MAPTGPNTDELALLEDVLAADDGQVEGREHCRYRCWWTERERAPVGVVENGEGPERLFGEVLDRE